MKNEKEKVVLAVEKKLEKIQSILDMHGPSDPSNLPLFDERKMKIKRIKIDILALKQELDLIPGTYQFKKVNRATIMNYIQKSPECEILMDEYYAKLIIISVPLLYTKIVMAFSEPVTESYKEFKEHDWINPYREYRIKCVN